MAEFHLPTAGIVGGETLIAREVREVAGSLKPSPEIKLIGDDSETDDDVLTPLTAEALDDVDALLLAGSPESCRKALQLAGDVKPRVIDLTGTLEDHPRARLRAPVVESEKSEGSAIDVMAHPAAVALALFFDRVARRFTVERSIVEIFEPASERGQAGLTELQTQCASLFAFKPLPKEVFDAQVAFNLRPEYGSESKTRLEEVEMRIDRHLATLLDRGSRMAMPSLRLVHAPVFHGYSFSIWIEFAAPAPDAAALEEALASASIEVRRSADEAPDNAGVAGEKGLIVGAVRPDRNRPRAFWVWLVADNLRLLAENAMAVAKEYL